MSLQLEKSIPSLFLNRTYRFGSQDLFSIKKNQTWTWVTWSQIEREFECVGKAILGLGVPPGFKAAIFSENRPEWIACDLAIMACKGVTVPIYTTSSPAQIKFILEHSESRILFISNKLFSESIKSILKEVPSIKKVVVYDLPSDANGQESVLNYKIFLSDRENTPPKLFYQGIEQIESNSVCSIVYTSGTTGTPKGVMLSHHNLLSNINGASQVIDIKPSDIALSFLPLSHTFERTAGVYTLLSMGAKIAFAEHHTKVLANITEVNPTVMCTVPRVLEKIYNRVFEMASQGSSIKRSIFKRAVAMLQDDQSYSAKGVEWNIYDKLIFSKIRDRLGNRFRFFCSGGAALSPRVGEFLERVGIPIIQGYGLTESSPIITVNRLATRKIDTVGSVIPNCTVEIAEDGEILASGPNIMLGYFKDPEATRAIIDEQGRLHTGDIGTLDEQGYLKITDRKKEFIVTSGGKKIAPQPIENELKAHSLIEQVCLVGDDQKYISALIVPNFEVLASRAKNNGIGFDDPKELLLKPEVMQWFSNAIDAVNKNLAAYETIKKFELLEKEFSIDAEEITPTLKLKRRVILKHYDQKIQSLYQ